MWRRERPPSVAAMNPPTDFAVEAHDLVKVFGAEATEVRALDGVDFLLERGEFVALMGPSGSGKSTLLHILGALDTPTEGQVAVGGRRYEGLDERELTRLRRDHIGFIFQFFNLLPSLSAVENVYLPALISGRRGKDVERRAYELLARVGLGKRAEHRPAELSGGEQQRVSIARALLLSPSCCSPTSRPATSTRAQAPRFWLCCARRTASTARQSSWSPTTPPPPRPPTR